MPDNSSPRIGPQLKRAIRRMVEDCDDFADAARKENFNVAAMRKALTRPHVIAYVRRARRSFRLLLSAGNYHRLAELRDQDENRLAAVQAVRLLEGEGDDDARSAPIERPGLVVVIRTGNLDLPASNAVRPLRAR